MNSRNPNESIPDDRWYEIDQNCSREELLAVSKVYAREVIDRFDLSVDVSTLEWSISMRAKRRAGAVKYSGSVPKEVILTWEYFENCGWEKVAETIRHELIHIHLLNEKGDSSHGPDFKRWAAKLDTEVNCVRFSEPKWWVTCSSCSNRYARYRRSKLVNRPSEFQCGKCGGRLAVVENQDDPDTGDSS